MNAQTRIDKADLSAGNPKAIAVRVASLSGGQVGGSCRHMLRVAPIPKYIDQTKMHLNTVIEMPFNARELRAVCKQRRAQRNMKRSLKKNAALAFDGLIAFGHEAQRDFEALSVSEQNRAYQEVAEAIAKRVNSTITGLVVHRDESAPHAHFQMPAFDKDGFPLNTTVKRDVTRDIQTIAADVVKQHVQTIERGRDKYERLANGADYADVINKSVRQLHDELPLEIEGLQADLDACRVKIEKNEARAAKSAEKAAESEKAAKLVTTYERRAEAATNAAQELEEQIQGLIRRQEALQTEERRLEPVRKAVEAMDAFKVQQKEYEAYEALDIFKVEGVEENEVFQRRFNKLNPMADLDGEYVDVIDVHLSDKNGSRIDGWHFKLPDDVASFLKHAFEAACKAGEELWVRVKRWNGGEPEELSESLPPPAKPRISSDVAELLIGLDQRSISRLRSLEERIAYDAASNSSGNTRSS